MFNEIDLSDPLCFSMFHESRYIAGKWLRGVISWLRGRIDYVGLNGIRISRMAVYGTLSSAWEKERERRAGREKALPFCQPRGKPRANPPTKGPSNIDSLVSLTCHLVSLACTPALDKGPEFTNAYGESTWNAFANLPWVYVQVSPRIVV